MSAAATWKPVYIVVGTADSPLRIDRREASFTQYSVTVRGGSILGRYTRYGIYLFERQYGLTPEEAVEKAIARYQAALGKATKELDDAKRLLGQAEYLQRKQRERAGEQPAKRAESAAGDGA